MRRIMKKVLDIFISLAALIILSPLMLVTAVMIKAFMGYPFVFKQMRPGLHGKPFYMYKFRTMTIGHCWPLR